MNDAAIAGDYSTMPLCRECKRGKQRWESCKFCFLLYFFLAFTTFTGTVLVLYYKEQLYRTIWWIPAPIPLLKPWLPWIARPPSLGGQVPRIVLWPAEEDGEQPTGQDIMEHCLTNPKRRPCYLTTHKGYLEVADAIVFNASRMKSYVLPTRRHPSQLWVFSTQHIALEHSPDVDEYVASLFNWTMSLRADADTVIPYGNWTDEGVQHSSSRERLLTAINSKSRSVAWFVSDCEAATRNGSDKLNDAGRVRSTELFMKQIVVDVQEVTVFRNCGRPLCSSRKECLEMAAKDFYFVFVYESSPCFQNPLEMIYDSFNYDIVPVYFGKRPGLGSLVPPGSVYDTSGEGTAFDISDKLLSLLDDTESYLEYLFWKDSITITTPEDVLCRLCDAAYTVVQHGTAVYDNVLTWWKRRTDCSDVPAHRGGPILEVELWVPDIPASASDTAEGVSPEEAPSPDSTTPREML